MYMVLFSDPSLFVNIFFYNIVLHSLIFGQNIAPIKLNISSCCTDKIYAEIFIVILLFNELI